MEKIEKLTKKLKHSMREKLFTEDMLKKIHEINELNKVPRYFAMKEMILDYVEKIEELNDEIREMSEF
jgi:hypothetical protein